MATTKRVREHLRELGLTLAATEDDVRRAYRRLVLVWHPDRFSNDPDMTDMAARKMARLSAAYGALREHFRSRREMPASAQRRSGKGQASAARAGGPQKRPPGPWRTYPAWLGYACVYVSAIHALGYLAMVLFYAHGPDTRSQTSHDAAVLAAIIPCFCMVWSGYLFYIGVLITLGHWAADERMLVWCAVQLVAAVLLAGVCALEAGEGATALQVGIPSAAYALFLLGMRAVHRVRPVRRGAPR